MKIKELVKNLLFLLFPIALLISCASQDHTPTAIPDETEVTTSETAVPTSTENLTETSNTNNPEPIIETEIENTEPLYALDWKLADNELIAYRTAMEPGENSSSSFSFNFDRLFTENDNSNEIREQLSDIKLPETFSMLSILEKNSAGNISVKLIFDEIGQVENEADNPIGNSINQILGEMEGTVQLRGELTPEGAIASFYLEQNQRNLLAMLFELPSQPVHVGDSWEIDVNCISMGNGFIAKNAERINRVELLSVTENDSGELVALLEYVIAETVEGDFQLPFSDDSDPVPTSMTCTFLGQGSFLIEKGRWEQLVGELSIQATGMMESDLVQHLALLPIENIPEEYTDQK